MKVDFVPVVFLVVIFLLLIKLSVRNSLAIKNLVFIVIMNCLSLVLYFLTSLSEMGFLVFSLISFLISMVNFLVLCTAFSKSSVNDEVSIKWR